MTEEFVWLTDSLYSEDQITAMNEFVQSPERRTNRGFALYIFSAASRFDPSNPAHRLYRPLPGFYARDDGHPEKLRRVDATAEQKQLMNAAVASVTGAPR